MHAHVFRVIAAKIANWYGLVLYVYSQISKHLIAIIKIAFTNLVARKNVHILYAHCHFLPSF